MFVCKCACKHLMGKVLIFKMVSFACICEFRNICIDFKYMRVGCETQTYDSEYSINEYTIGQFVRLSKLFDIRLKSLSIMDSYYHIKYYI